jgi:hypothetical protein
MDANETEVKRKTKIFNIFHFLLQFRRLALYEYMDTFEAYLAVK